MRVLTVSHFFESHGGGIERVAAKLCAQFVRDGHRTTWAASDADLPPQNEIEAIPLRCANPTEGRLGLPMPVPGARAVRDLSRAVRDADAVVIHDALYLTSIVAMVLAKLRGKPVVLIQHIAGIAFANPIMRGMMRLANHVITRPMLSATDRLIFISDEVRRDLLGEPARREYALLHNGVDTAVFWPQYDTDRAAGRAALGLPRNARIAAFVGRFVAKKGMTALETLARRRPDLNFALAGSGPVHPEEWGLPNVYVVGSLSPQKIAWLYAISDVLLLPSVGEGYPLVIQEAMACGLPVVCGDRSARADPAATQWLRGVDINLGDPAGSALRCSEAIDNLFENPPDRDAMASYAARTYNWSTMARAIVQSISECVEPTYRTAGRLQPG